MKIEVNIDNQGWVATSEISNKINGYSISDALRLTDSGLIDIVRFFSVLYKYGEGGVITIDDIYNDNAPRWVDRYDGCFPTNVYAIIIHYGKIIDRLTKESFERGVPKIKVKGVITDDDEWQVRVTE